MKRVWTAAELAEHWTLGPADYHLLANKRGATRLGFVVLLKFFQYTGRFPADKHEIPGAVIAHLASQVDVPTAAWLAYPWQGRTLAYHRGQIRQAFGFRPTTVADAQALVTWLREQVVPQAERLPQVREAAYARCRALRLEPPTPARLDRLIQRACHQYDTQVCAAITARLSDATRARLEAILQPADAPCDHTIESTAPAEPTLTMRDLRREVGAVSVDSLATVQHTLLALRALALPDDLFAPVPRRLLDRYAQQASAETVTLLRRHPTSRRLTLLAALCWQWQRALTDALVDLVVHLVHQIGARAERKVDQEVLRELKRIGGKTELLFQIAEAALAQPDGTIREVVFPIAAEATLRALVQESHASGPRYRLRLQTHMRHAYRSYYRRMLPTILTTLAVTTDAPEYLPVLQAVTLLIQYQDRPQRWYDLEAEVPLEGIVRGGWRHLVLQEDAQGQVRVERVAYELCVLQALRDGLRCRAIWVAGADRYRNPADDLPTDFAAQRATYYAALHQPEAADAFVATLQHDLTVALRTLNADLPTNPHVHVLAKAGGSIQLSPLTPQPEPPQLDALKAELLARWPMTSLLDILKEAELRTGFCQHFTTVTDYERLDRETLRKRLLLCLYGLGTNTGYKRVAAGDPGTNEHDLRYVRRRYLTAAHLRAACAQLVNAIFAARSPRWWGEGTTACAADAKQFPAWDQNLLTEWHARYGGRGIAIYWHVERKAACIYSQVKSCSSSEVAAMIEGVLRHCSDAQLDRTYVDSHGQSAVAFALTYVLGFQLLPRLKGLHRQKLYQVHAGDRDAYPQLHPILTRPIDWELVRQQYDAIIQHATALRVGTADAEAILRRFTRTAVQHPTYRALVELGRAVKTLFLCRYLSSLALRQEIQEGLNVLESWNSVNAFIFSGRGGEISTNRYEDQEVTMLCLQLVQLALVFVNTLMLQEVLGTPAWAERLTPADLRGLSPLLHSHINPYGAFLLDMGTRLPLATAS